MIKMRIQTVTMKLRVKITMRQSKLMKTQFFHFTFTLKRLKVTKMTMRMSRIRLLKSTTDQRN